VNELRVYAKYESITERKKKTPWNQKKGKKKGRGNGKKKKEKRVGGGEKNKCSLD